MLYPGRFENHGSEGFGDSPEIPLPVVGLEFSLSFLLSPFHVWSSTSHCFLRVIPPVSVLMAPPQWWEIYVQHGEEVGSREQKRQHPEQAVFWNESPCVYFLCLWKDNIGEREREKEEEEGGKEEERERKIERHTHRDRDREREMEKEREADTKTKRKVCTQRHTHAHSHLVPSAPRPSASLPHLETVMAWL